MCEVFKIALVPVPVGAKPGDGGLATKRRHSMDQDSWGNNLLEKGRVSYVPECFSFE